MATAIIDIETVGEPWDEIDHETQKLLIERVERLSGGNDEEELLKTAQGNLGLQPLTGRIIVIGVYDLETEKSVVWFDTQSERMDALSEDTVKFIPASERDMLEKFWLLAGRYQRFVTFSGRMLDVPFLLLRSAALKIKPTKDLMRSRYLYQQSPDAQHIDLYDQLSFYGAVSRLGGLHLACRAFGIDTPKDGEIDGSKVQQYFLAKKYLEIARYNARDLSATAKLYQAWQKYLTF